jgi:NADPH-dependent glutamate synthase beta subunit-like oxidoreductase
MSRTDRPLEQAAAFRIRAQQLEKLPPCQAQCPNSGDIRSWLGIIAQHEKDGISLHEAYDRAWAKIAERNPLPATIGRICPHPCEDRCTRADKDGAVSINAMERFLGDWGLSRSLPLPTLSGDSLPESIGVIGSGPASLSFAYQMARRGYAVTVYEKGEEPGGMLRHAIPDYRLPRSVLDAEIHRILDLDIAFIANAGVGENVGLAELRERHTLLFLGFGAQAARRLSIPGEDGPGVTPGIDYLLRRKGQAASLNDQRVLVIGGGNTAIDAARSARRDGASVTLVYRRSAVEMPASPEEIAEARDEGVGFRFLAAPVRILREDGRVRGVEIQAMRLGEPDESGRRRPESVPDSIETLPADRVFVAVSQAPAWPSIDGVADEDHWMRTAADGRLADDIWAGGDDTGPGIASRAIAQGRLAAESAHAELRGEPRPGLDEMRKAIQSGMVKQDYYASSERVTVACRAVQGRLADPEAEVVPTISDEQALHEAQRCMSCGLCFDCELCFMYCNQAGFTRIGQPSPGHYFVLALDACEGCGKCIEMCPCGYLEKRDG